MEQVIYFRRFILAGILLFTPIFLRQTEAQEKTGITSMVLTGLQMDVTGDIEKNKNQILDGIRKAAQEGASFLVTPEGSLSGYTSNFDQASLVGALEEVRVAAVKMKTGLMLGTCFKEIHPGMEICHNQVRVYAPDGQYLGAYSKILRCSSLDHPGSGEMAEYAEGELKTFDWNGVRFGILICNDLWATPGYTTMANPYLPWKLREMGARFIVHCINSGTAQKYRPFHESSAELWALSLQLPIMEVNAAQGSEIINARSGLIDARGERPVSAKDSGSQSFTVKIAVSGSKVDGQK